MAADGKERLMHLMLSARKIATAAMQKTMDEAKAICKDTTAFKDQTGDLRRSIDAGLTDADGNQIEGILSAGSPNHGRSHEYAGLVELGHEGPNRAAPHPYIEPTMVQVDDTGVLANNLIGEFNAELG